MIHVAAMKRLIGLPLLTHIEILWRSRSFKNRGVGVGSFKNRGVGVWAFVYRLHSPGLHEYKVAILFDRFVLSHLVYLIFFDLATVIIMFGEV
jgi:hypothetical protein